MKVELARIKTDLDAREVQVVKLEEMNQILTEKHDAAGRELLDLQRKYDGDFSEQMGASSNLTARSWIKQSRSWLNVQRKRRN